MEIVIIVKLFAALLFWAMKYDAKNQSKHAYKNYYSNGRSANTSYSYRENSPQGYLADLYNSKGWQFDRHVYRYQDDTIKFKSLVERSNFLVINDVMDKLADVSKVKDEANLVERSRIYINIIRFRRTVVNVDKICKQLSFIQYSNPRVIILLNLLEDQMILENQIKVVRAINAIQAKITTS
jgi:hypothetical protein